MVRKQYQLFDAEEYKDETKASDGKKKEVKSQLSWDDVGALQSEDELEDDENGELRVSYTLEEVLSDEYESPKMTRQEVQARRAIYNEVKKKVKMLEKKNTSKIYVFRDWRIPWFKAGGNSAYFYAFDIAGRAGKKNVNINADRDNHSAFKEGIVSFNQTHHLFATMEKAGIAPPKVLNNGWILVFDTGHTYSKTELKELKRASLERKRAVNGLVMPNNAFPRVYNDILTLIKRVQPNIYKLNANQRQALAGNTVEHLITIHKIYLEMTNGRMPVLRGATLLQDELDWFVSLLKILMEGGFWDMGVCAPIGQIMADLRDDIIDEIIKPERKRLAEEESARARGEMEEFEEVEEISEIEEEAEETEVEEMEKEEAVDEELEVEEVEGNEEEVKEKEKKTTKTKKAEKPNKKPNKNDKKKG